MNILKQIPKPHCIAIIILLILMLIVLFLPSKVSKEPLQGALRIQPVVTSETQLAMDPVLSDEKWLALYLAGNQSIDELFATNNLSIDDAIEIVLADRNRDSILEKLSTGQEIKVKLSASNEILAIDITLPNEQQAFFIRQEDGTFLAL